MRPHRGNASEKEGGEDGKGGRLLISYQSGCWFGATYASKHGNMSYCESRVRVEVVCLWLRSW
jgi:hypothetical protein